MRTVEQLPVKFMSDVAILEAVRAGNVVVRCEQATGGWFLHRASRIADKPKPIPTVPYMWLGADADAVNLNRVPRDPIAKVGGWPDPRAAWRRIDWR